MGFSLRFFGFFLFLHLFFEIGSSSQETDEIVYNRIAGKEKNLDN